MKTISVFVIESNHSIGWRPESIYLGNFEIRPFLDGLNYIAPKFGGIDNLRVRRLTDESEIQDIKKAISRRFYNGQT